MSKNWGMAITFIWLNPIKLLKEFMNVLLNHYKCLQMLWIILMTWENASIISKKKV